jgi:hypothetical protein
MGSRTLTSGDVIERLRGVRLDLEAGCEALSWPWAMLTQLTMLDDVCTAFDLDPADRLAVLGLEAVSLLDTPVAVCPNPAAFLAVRDD